MSIYKKVLGEKFSELHPMLQKRYRFSNNETFIGKGTMHHISGGALWFKPILFLGVPFKLLFPERGNKVPFTIVNRPKINKYGHEEIYWERIFYFQNKKRYFNARMSFDPKHRIVKDYLGEPSILYSDLLFNVTEEGGLLIQSKRQRLVLGILEVPLPKFLQGIATVLESYVDKKEAYQIKVTVQNPLLGTIFLYEGEFRNVNIP